MLIEDFNAQIKPEILRLAENILDVKEIENAHTLSKWLLGSEEDKEHAIHHLQELFENGPKRPLYYLGLELRWLPENTRNIVRYAGDYIDQMIKYCSYEKGDFLIFRFRGLYKSLGVNIAKLKNILPEKLLPLLREFNEIIYVPAKHDFDVKNRPHLFSAKEAVFVCFMVKRLAVQIIPFSKLAQIYDANEMVDYYYDRSQKKN